MLTQVLRARLEGISPEGKFVLVRFIQLYGLDTTQTLNVLELAEAIGATGRLASAAIKQLVASGLLSRVDAGKKRGRPSSGYCCSRAVLAEKLDLGSGILPKSVHGSLVANLLNDAVKKEKGKLLYGNRLLLTVLLTFADEFGVVRGLGRRDITDLTGFKNAVIGSRIETLLSHGFIRAYVPGSSSSGLFKPMKSSYYLNLPQLGLSHFSPQIALIHHSKFISYENEMSEAQRIFNGAEQKGRGESFDERRFPYLHRIEQLSSWLSYPAAKPSLPILQSRLDDCAALILSTHWSRLQDKKTIADSALWWKVCRSVRVKDGLLGREHKSKRKVLMMALLGAALSRAKGIHRDLVADFPDLPLHAMEFCILPKERWEPIAGGQKVRQHHGLVTLLASAPILPIASGCLVVEKSKGQPAKQLFFPAESKLPVDRRCLYGLITKANS